MGSPALLGMRPVRGALFHPRSILLGASKAPSALKRARDAPAADDTGRKAHIDEWARSRHSGKTRDPESVGVVRRKISLDQVQRAICGLIRDRDFDSREALPHHARSGFTSRPNTRSRWEWAASPGSVRNPTRMVLPRWSSARNPALPSTSSTSSYTAANGCGVSTRPRRSSRLAWRNHDSGRPFPQPTVEAVQGRVQPYEVLITASGITRS